MEQSLKAFFFGAGSSCGTVCAPVAARFGCALGGIDGNWRVSYPALLQVVHHLNLPLDNWGLEPVWSCIDYYAKLREAIGTAPPWTDESPQFKKALLKVYGQRCDQQAEQLPLNGTYTLGNILKNNLQPGDYLISFNYDTVVERLARRFGIQLRSAGAENTNSAIVLVKPHGSTSWPLELPTQGCPGNVTSATPDGGPLFDSLTDADVDTCREPLVLGAVPIKSELIREVQMCNDTPAVFTTIQNQWKAVVKAIGSADSLVIIGYSFPREDQYGRFLMQEGVRQRNGRQLDIAFYELEDQQPQTAMQITEVFGGCIRDLSFCGPVIGPPPA